MKKKTLFSVAILALIVMLFGLTACGKKEEKKHTIIGTWEGKTNDGLVTTFNFKEDGNVEYSNEYGFESEGTYKIDGDKVTIDLEIWDGQAKVYSYEIKDGKMNLTATDEWSPSYTDMVKK